MEELIGKNANAIHKDLCDEGLVETQMRKVLEMVIEIEESDVK